MSKHKDELSPRISQDGPGDVTSKLLSCHIVIVTVKGDSARYDGEFYWTAAVEKEKKIRSSTEKFPPCLNLFSSNIAQVLMHNGCQLDTQLEGTDTMQYEMYLRQQE